MSQESPHEDFTHVFRKTPNSRFLTFVYLFRPIKVKINDDSTIQNTIGPNQQR